MPERRMKRMVSSVRAGLIGLVLITLLPAIGILLLGGAGRAHGPDLHWTALAGMVAAPLLAAWLWSRFAILGPLDAVLAAAHRMRRGDLTARVGLDHVDGDVGQLARAFDAMAAGLETREAEASQAVAALRESNEQLHAILTASPLAIITLDRQGRVMHWTPAAERIFGWRSDEVLGRFMPWVPEALREESFELMRRTNSGEKLSGIHMRRRRKDGRPVDLRVSTAPLRRPDGTLCGTLGLLEDVTERRRLEEQLHRSQKMQAIGRLAGGLAHDFNNLLTVIRGHAELALRKSDAPGPAHTHLLEIRRAALRANALTRQLLTFSRQPAGEPRVLGVNAAIEEIAGLLRPLLGEGVWLTIEPGGDAGCIRADDGQLAQVLTNLAVNARDAMPRGGEIRIRTRRAEPAPTRAGSEPGPGGWCEIAVSDAGVGMDADTLQQVFEPFFSTKEMTEGAGLGLSTVYAIVMQAGGDVRVESEPGKGSTFHVYFPRLEAGAEPAPGLARDLSIPIRGSGTVLLVEDEAEVRSVLRQTLENAGYTVLESASGTEALERSAQHDGPIDLLLTDVVMPGLGGPDLAARLVAQRPGLRALFISGYAPAVLDATHSIPGAAFMAKPFDLARLTAKVHELLSAPEDDVRAA